MGWKVVAAFAGAGAAILAAHLCSSRRCRGTPAGASTCRKSSYTRGCEEGDKPVSGTKTPAIVDRISACSETAANAPAEDSKQEADSDKGATAVPLASARASDGMPSHVRQQLVALAKKLLQTQDTMEGILDGRLAFKGKDYNLKTMEEASSFFIDREAGIAVEMAVLLCKHSTASPSDSKKAGKGTYSAVSAGQHARIIAQDILDIGQSEAKRASPSFACPVKAKEVAKSRTRHMQSRQAKLGLELAVLVQKYFEEDASSEIEGDEVEPSVEQALVGVDNKQAELASALRVLEAERNSLLDKLSLAGSTSSHETISEEMATKRWQQAQIAVKLADLMAQQAEAVGKIQGLVAQEAEPSGSGSGGTTSGDSAAVASPINDQLAGLGVQLAGLLNDESNFSSFHGQAVNGGPPARTCASTVNHQEADDVGLNLVIQESLMATEEEQLSRAIEASRLDAGLPRTSRLQIGGNSNCH